MGKKKSASQIARMQKRAEARGEVYEAPVYEKEEAEPEEDNKAADSKSLSKPVRKKLAAATKLHNELERITKDEGMKSKERRSAKRKAEAIAAEESGCSLEELTSWYEETGKALQEAQPKEEAEATKKEVTKKKDPKEEKKHKKSNPYIVFIGQLSYQTTKEELFDHIQKELGSDFDVTEETIKIRLLTDSKTRKSRGMAFVETTSDPELLYALLKLHHTHLNDRRINVERSAGGNKTSASRQKKLEQYRKEQAEYIAEHVENIINEHKKTGELQENELDEGVVELCKRHSAQVVEQALTRYLETNGRDKDNPSAYFTHLIGIISTEGFFENINNKVGGDENKKKQSKRKREEPSATESENGLMGNKLLKKSSEFSKKGVDMSISASGGKGFAKIFPSMNRGRGRSGRGYM